MSEKIIQYFLSLNLPVEIITIIISALPILEIRGGLPVAISIFKMHWLKAYVLSVFGNIIVVPFLMIFFEKFAKFLGRYKIFATLLDLWFAKAKKSENLIKKYGSIGLMIFVAIPLPMTGAWTAAALAYLANLKKSVAFLMISFGVIESGIIVLLLTLGIIEIVV